MTIEPISDQGQQMEPPAGKVIGFLDSKADFEAFAASVRAAGFPASKVTLLDGDDGIRLLERLKESHFFFADSEDSIIQLSMQELAQGHCAVAVDVAGHDEAANVASLATPHGGRGFTYFGTWVSEQLSG